MAIVVNNPAETRDVDSGSDAVSWMFAVAIIIILAVGAFYLLPRLAYRAPAPQTPAPQNINVTIPTPTTGGANTGSGATGNTGGTSQTQ